MLQHEQRFYLDQIVLLDTFGLLLEQRFSILQVCDYTAIAVPYYDRDLAEVKQLCSTGHYPFNSLGAHEKVHPALKHFFAVGSETGSLDRTLRNGTEYLAVELRLKESDVKQKEVNEIQFYNALAMFIDAGYPLAQSVRTIADFAEEPYHNKLRFIKQYVEQDNTLYSSLEKYPELFDPATVERIKQAEVRPKKSESHVEERLIAVLRQSVLSMVGEKTNSQAYQAAQHILRRPHNNYL